MVVVKMDSRHVRFLFYHTFCIEVCICGKCHQSICDIQKLKRIKYKENSIIAANDIAAIVTNRIEKSVLKYIGSGITPVSHSSNFWHLMCRTFYIILQLMNKYIYGGILFIPSSCRVLYVIYGARDGIQRKQQQKLCSPTQTHTHIRIHT